MLELLITLLIVDTTLNVWQHFRLSGMIRQLDALTRRLTQYEAADDGGI